MGSLFPRSSHLPFDRRFSVTAMNSAMSSISFLRLSSVTSEGGPVLLQAIGEGHRLGAPSSESNGDSSPPGLRGGCLLPPPPPPSVECRCALYSLRRLEVEGFFRVLSMVSRASSALFGAFWYSSSWEENTSWAIVHGGLFVERPCNLSRTSAVVLSDSALASRRSEATASLAASRSFWLLRVWLTFSSMAARALICCSLSLWFLVHSQCSSLRSWETCSFVRVQCPRNSDTSLFFCFAQSSILLSLSFRRAASPWTI